MKEPCDCCAQRDKHMYRVGCQRCEARAYARAPRRNVETYLATLPVAFQALVDDERERDALTGFEA